ncbi:hypothetical protein AB0K34_11070 [Actinomadura sp. NPDC049382]|uniref:hypothetical protein n=1 Tax=Actinomadura sp. NPDC049382 TaxID=3158220 RepID=UPI0034445EAC
MKVQCAHPDAVPVVSGGQTVAGLCPGCDGQLPAAWFTCDHSDTIEVTALDQRYPQYLCLQCDATFAGSEPVIP